MLMSNMEWLINATTYANKNKQDSFFKEFAWIYVDLQYGHDEKNKPIKYA